MRTIIEMGQEVGLDDSEILKKLQEKIIGLPLKRAEAYHPVPIRTYEFDLKSNLAYGGSEGIYLDLWREYFADDEKHTSSIGTFKTLHESKEAMHTMAALLADFILLIKVVTGVANMI